MPAGSCRPMTPAKMRSVAWPRIFGPTTLRATLTTREHEHQRRPGAAPGAAGAAAAWPTARSPSTSRRACPARPRRAAAAAARCAASASGPGGLVGVGAVGVACRVRSDVAHAAASAGELGLARSPRRSGRSRSSSSCVPIADHRAVVEHDDLVGVDDRRDPLRDDDHRGVAGDGPQRRAQPRVGGEVERRERVVEQVDLRLARPAPGRSPAAAAGRRRSWCRPARPARRGRRASLDEVVGLRDLAGPPTARRRWRPGLP